MFRDGTWYIQGSQQGFFAFQFGNAGDIPHLVIFMATVKRCRRLPQRYLVCAWFDGRFFRCSMGKFDRIPATADYDGDGKADFVVFRPGEGNWYLLRSQAGVSVFNFGLTGDQPIPAQSN